MPSSPPDASMRANILRCLYIAALSSGGAASAQDADPTGGGKTGAPAPSVIVVPPSGTCTISGSEQASIPPEKFAQSPGNVDMRTGQYMYTHTDLSLGSTGFDLIRHWNADEGHFGTIGGFTHNWDIYLVQKRVRVCEARSPNEFDYVVSVTAGNRSKSFRTDFTAQEDGFRQSSTNDSYAELHFTYGQETQQSGYVVNVPIAYTLYADDGSQLKFNDNEGTGAYKNARIAEVVEPDGTIYWFDYDVASTAPLSKRLRRVRNNRGYALLFEYSASGASGQWVVSKSCLINYAYTSLPNYNSESICPVGAKNSTYSYSAGLLSSYVDQTGASTLIGPSASAIYRPGETTPYLQNTITTDINGNKNVTQQTFADGQTYSYTWQNTGNAPYKALGGSYTNAAGKTVTVSYGKYRQPDLPNDLTYFATPTPERITDELGRSTTWFYCSYSSSGRCTIPPPSQQTMPDGDKYEYVYNGNRQIISKKHIAKPGSSLAAVLETTTFDCTALACRTKPTSRTDANNKTVTFVYEPSHGGVLSQTDPAGANGIPAVKRYAYVQRAAWLTNGAGGFVQSSAPIWLLAQERTCRTTATNAGAIGSATGCAGGSADEVITTYDYGPDTGAVANNLWLRGVGVTADGQTRWKCFGYDASGNKISETSPGAGLTSCS